MALKRFLLFSRREGLPAGGWGDFVNSFDTLSETVTAGEDATLSGARYYVTMTAIPRAPVQETSGWWHVIDSTSGEQVAGVTCTN